VLVTARVYAQVMEIEEGERDHLRTLVEGNSPAGNATATARSQPDFFLA
jgi:hypothetical protein